MPTEGEKSPEAENNNNNNKKGKTGGSQVKHKHTHTHMSREVPKLLAFKMKCSASSVSCSGHLSLGWMKRSSLGAMFLLPGHVFDRVLRRSDASCVTEVFFFFLICP